MPRMQVMFKSFRTQSIRPKASPTLVDPLEQRLLYSADHPLGLAIAVDTGDDLQESLEADHLTALGLASLADASS